MSASRAAIVRVPTLPCEALAALAAPEIATRLAARLAEERAAAAEAESLSAGLHQLAGTAADAGPAGAAMRTGLLALRRDVFHGRVRTIDRELLAGLPAALAARITAHAAGVERRRTEAEALAAAFDRSFESTAAALLATMIAPLSAEGLRLVSRSLLEKVRRAAVAGTPGRAAGDRQVLGKAASYLARFTTKTSPNGVFCATGRAGVVDRAAVGGTNRLARVVVRLAVGEARKIAACLAADPALETIIVPRPNPTLRRTATGWTFWKTASARHPDDTEVRSEMPEHPVVAAFVAASESGARNVPTLIAAAAARCGLDSGSPALREFFGRLIERGILTAEIEIPWSAERPLAELARRVRAAGAAPSWLDEIESIEATVAALGDRDAAARTAALDPIAARLEALPHVRPLSHDELFRTDAATALEIALPHEVAGEIERFAALYARFYAALYPARLFRARNVRKFLARWPADTDVELLDLYHGVFESGASSARAAFPEPHFAAGSPEWEAARRAFAACRDGLACRARATAPGGEIELGAADWDELLGTAPESPPFHCGVLFQVAAADPAAITAGRWRATINAIYPGGGLAVARLAALHAPRSPGEAAWIEEELARGHRWLEREGAVLAEVSFMHGGRTANAGLRPPLLAHEIVLPGDFATPGRVALPLADLVVRWDSMSGELVLRSRSRGVQVLPVVTSGIST
jgi:hypothetical protein